jgi:hypothetical protein
MERLLTFLRLPTVAVLATAIGLSALVTYSPPADPDLFARTAVGRLVEINGGVVHQDPFGYTPRLARWVDHEWLSGVVFYQVARLGGDWGLLLLNLGFMLGTVILVAAAQRQVHGGKDWSPPWLFLAMVPVLGVWISVVRSRVFTFAFLALLLLVLVRWREGRTRWLWVIPPAFLLWANMHGGFVAGLGLLGVSAAAVSLESPRRSVPLWGCLALSVAATLVNPYGIEYWDYILSAVTMDRPGIAEWGPLPLGSIFGVHVLLYLGIFLAGSLLSDRRPPPEAWAMVAVAFLATLSSRRITNFFMVILAIYGAGAARAFAGAVQARIPGYWEAGRRVMAVVFVAGIGLAAGKTLQHLATFARSGLDFEAFPTQAVDWLQSQGSGGRLLVHFNHGSYALWRLYPEYRVSMDGRYEETYPQSTVDAVYRALLPDHPEHRPSMRMVSPDYILVEGVDEAGGFGAEWQVAFRDGRFVLLAHDTLSHRAAPRSVRPLWEPGF